MLESFVRDSIQEHMEHLNLYARCQHGFRKNRSCITQLLQVLNDFSNYIDQGTPFDAIYLDFRKAFDTVPHQRLLTKLKAYGITGNLYHWIESFLTDRTQYVRVGKEYSSTSPVSSGIPQGSVLGPILFVIFINDLPEGLKSVCGIFADDTKIHNKCEYHSTIQSDISKLEIWSETWQLYFNNGKCKCVHYGHNNPKHKYYFNTKDGPVEIAEADTEKDLGVIFDSSLKFDQHIKAAVNKANAVLGLIKRNFEFIHENIFLKLYKALVRPHLEYGQSVWSPHLVRQSVLIENVQRRASKLVKKLSNLSYDERLRSLKLPSLKYRRLRGDLITVYNIIKQDNVDDSILTLSNTKVTRGHDLKLYKENSKTNFRKFSFSQRVINYWNALTTNTVHANTVNAFKKLLDENLKNLHYVYD